MPTMRIEPSGYEIEVPAGETIMQAARDADYYWPTACEMQCRCATCFVIIVEGGEHFSPMGRAEEAALRQQRGQRALEEPVRLACQVMIDGDVVVRKLGVRSS